MKPRIWDHAQSRQLRAAGCGPLPQYLRRVVRRSGRLQHIHFHIIPRQPGLEADLRGPRVFGLLSGDPASYVPEAVMDEIAGRLSQALHLEL